MKISLLVVALVLGSLACASSPGPTPERHDRDRITEDEIVASQAADAYEAIRKLRPNFLTSRGSTSLNPDESSLPTVFVDGVQYGPVSTLSSISASSVAEIRMFRSWDAATTYGTGYMSGVIAVTTRK